MGESLALKFPTTDKKLIADDIKHTARHFYELGLKAKKENTASANIERNNYKVKGHSGVGRYDLIGSINSFKRLTEPQAAKEIGESVLSALCKYCAQEDIDMVCGRYGVTLSIEFEKYERE